MVGNVSTTRAYQLADILGIPLQLDGAGNVTGRGNFVAQLGDLGVEFPLDVIGATGSATTAFAVARSRGNLLILAGGDRDTSWCAFVDVAIRPEWRGWFSATKAQTVEAAARELGKAVVATFKRQGLTAWSRVG